MTRMLMGLVALLLVTASGCSTMNFQNAKKVPEGFQLPPSQTVAVEFRKGTKVEVEEIPLEPGMTVGSALTKIKPHKHYRNIQVDLGRSQGAIEPLKMAVKYDNVKRSVDPTTDYSVRANDRIIIQPDETSPIDKLMSMVMKTTPKRK